jgi:hypothetical protein
MRVFTTVPQGNLRLVPQAARLARIAGLSHVVVEVQVCAGAR